MSPEDLNPLKGGIWWAGNLAWGFGLTERTAAALSDGFLGAVDIGLIATAALIFVGWLFLKPWSKQP